MDAERVIYAVESGEYSDYSVDALFSTRARAEAYAAWANGPPRPDGWAVRDSRVIEYPLDAPIPKTGRWEIGGTLDEWLTNADTLGEGYWLQEATGRTEASRERVGSIWITARGKDHARTLRSGREMARAIKAGTYIVPPAAP